MPFHQTIVAAWVQLAVLSSKNPEYITLLPLPRDVFCEFFHSPAVSVPWQVETIEDAQ
jgi:hypothetical protein